MNDSGELAAPAIYNGVMYVINGKSLPLLRWSSGIPSAWPQRSRMVREKQTRLAAP